MAIDTHIKIEGVEGEATHVDHKGEIELLSWQWGVSNSSMTTGGGSGKGKANAGEMVIMKLYDKASPNLAKKCVQGVHLPTVTLTARKSGEGQKDFFKVIMKEVFITSVQNSASSGGDMSESVSLSYGAIDFSYKAQDAKGTPGGEVKFGWDVKTTKVT